MSVEPFTEERPWGGFRQFSNGEPSTVKTLLIKAGEAFSLQHHLHRDEFWHVLSGEPEVTIGTEVIKAKPHDEFKIMRETNHRISAPHGDVEVLEVSRGEFREDDIIRIEDKYGRT